MKKSGIWGIVAACLVLAASVALLCVYMRELRRFFKTSWEKLEAKRADLKLYME